MVAGRLSGVRVILEDIHDPHNAAAIMRTCDALGIQEVWLIFEQEKPYNPRRVGKSSSSSANKWLSFRTFRTTAECIAALQEEGYQSVATVLQDADTALGEYDFTELEKVALWVGNEHCGLSDAARDAAVARMKLPMRGMVESLNVSVATALFLYEITRELRATGGRKLPTDAQEALLAELLAR